jgi:hypothetical protein
MNVSVVSDYKTRVFDINNLMPLSFSIMEKLVSDNKFCILQIDNEYTGKLDIFINVVKGAIKVEFLVTDDMYENNYEDGTLIYKEGVKTVYTIDITKEWWISMDSFIEEIKESFYADKNKKTLYDVGFKDIDSILYIISRVFDIFRDGFATNLLSCINDDRLSDILMNSEEPIEYKITHTDNLLLINFGGYRFTCPKMWEKEYIKLFWKMISCAVNGIE